MAEQSSWRYCQNCHLMFFDGYPNKGRCSAGSGHTAQGLNFSLPYGTAATGTAQDKWRYCEKCNGMFYDGYGDKGNCFAGGNHVAQGIIFALPHSLPASLSAQDKWRYCEKCHGMFYDGYPDKGRCPAGSGHNAQGLNFTLPHNGNTGATSAADLKWMGVPLPMLATVALNEFSDAFQKAAKGQIDDNWLIDLDTKIRNDPFGFKLGYAEGVLTGLWTGLKSLFETVRDLFKLAIALSAPMLVATVVKEGFYLLTDSIHVELRKRQIAEAEKIASAAKATIEDIAVHPDDYVDLSKDVGTVLGRSAGQWFKEDFLQRSAKEIGEAVGDIVGQAAFEIMLQIVIELTTAGLGNVARGAIVAGQGAKGGFRVVTIVEALKPLLRRTKGLQKFIQLLIRDTEGALKLGSGLRRASPSALGTLVGTSKSQMRMEAARRIAASKNHPLKFLLDAEGKFKTLPNRMHSTLINHPDVVEMGHIVSDKAGGVERIMLQSAWDNQFNNVTAEGLKKGGKNLGVFIENVAVDIGGIAVDLKSAEWWVKEGLLSEAILKNAPRLIF